LNNEQLVADYAASRSPASLDQIVRDNQRLLHHVLKRFATADEPYEDLLQVANLGLIKAVQRFDPGKGVRFSTYAVPVIEGEVRHHLRDSSAATTAALGQEGLPSRSRTPSAASLASSAARRN
jgi:RNA polymerase sigma-B factor